MPGFWIGLLMIGFLALRLGWFPAGGSGSGFAGDLWHLFLPALTLALSFLAVLVRNLRASLIEVLEADYVSLAVLKGIPRLRVYTRHVLRNALIPAVTIVGLNLSYLLGASVVVESVFSVDGIGNTLVNAVLSRDYQLVQGLALVFGVLVLLITLTVDIIQAALQPEGRAGVSATGPGSSGQPRSLGRPVLRASAVLPFLRGREHISMLAGCGLLGLVVLAAIFAPLICRYSPTALNPAAALEPPGAAHYFGTDQFGRDIFARTVYAARIDLIIAFSLVGTAFVIRDRSRRHGRMGRRPAGQHPDADH